MTNTINIMNLLIPNNKLLDYFGANPTKKTLIYSQKTTIFTVGLKIEIAQTY